MAVVVEVDVEVDVDMAVAPKSKLHIKTADTGQAIHSVLSI